MTSHMSAGERSWWAATLVAALLAFAIPPAFAASSSQEAYTWEDGNGKCVSTRSTIYDNGAANVHARGRQEQYWYYGWVDCSRDWERGAHDYRANNYIFKHNGSTWGYCVPGSWVYNASPNNEVFAYEAFGSARCGAGQYANFGYGQLRWDGSYRGTYTFSGSIYQG